MTKVIITNTQSPYVRGFERILKQWLPNDFREDFAGESFLNYPHKDTLKIIILLENDQCIGGAVISEKVIFNAFKSQQHTHCANKLKQQGYANFCYFAIEEGKRGQGYGGLVLNHIANHNIKCWLSCKPHLSAFYIRHGFELTLASNAANSGIFIYNGCA